MSEIKTDPGQYSLAPHADAQTHYNGAVTSIDHVLLVDDDLGDILLTKRAVARGAVPVQLHTAQNGRDAMAFLHQEGQFADAPRPRLVILDLHLRGTSGLTVLESIKSDPALATIPVIVFTTSYAEVDVEAAYRAGANAYVCKPIGFNRVVQDVIYYFVRVSLPPPLP